MPRFYNYPKVLMFEANGSFDPADYAWATEVEITVVPGGGGGAGGFTSGDNPGGPGGGSGYPAVGRIALAAIEGVATITVGEGGAGGLPAAGGSGIDKSGEDGGASSFVAGSFVLSGDGGKGGFSSDDDQRGGDGYSGGGGIYSFPVSGGDGGSGGQDGTTPENGLDPGSGVNPPQIKIGMEGGLGGQILDDRGNERAGGGGGGGYLPGVDAEDGGDEVDGELVLTQGGRGGKGYGAGGGGGAYGQPGGAGAPGVVKLVIW